MTTAPLPWPTVPGDCPTLLVTMPFMDIDRPSIQLGLLQEIGRAHGFPVRTLHANLDFAARLGPGRYRALSAHRARMVGDWLFAKEAFGAAAPDRAGSLPVDFADDLTDLGGSPDEVRTMLTRVREDDVPAYLDGLVDAVAGDDLRVVGFTSTYQQNAASFALARRLKKRHPHLVTVFGGANFDGDMGLELVRAVDCVDYAVIGEGDRAFPALLAALAAGAGAGAIPGVAYRTAGGAVVSTPAEPPLAHLDASPVPDYDEYFDRAERLALLPRAARRHVWIPFESARGCWWGAKHHCTFCGLNANSMAFRAKSPGRVLGELGRQARRYHSFHFQAVDNILDLTYLKKLFPVLVESDTHYDIFYEVKANLSRAQLRLLAQAGVGQIQPGIESLSSRVLQLMRKGVRAAQNVNLLRWARYYRIDVGWNILWGFPGESEQDYEDQVRVIPHLRHLTPPSNVTRVWMERFSPLYREREALRMVGVRPEPSYSYVYPDGVDLSRVAYFFEYELPVPPPGVASGELTDAVAAWQDAWRAPQRPALTYRSAPGFVQIHDGRGTGPAGVYTFEDKLADIYLACVERPTTAAAVRERIGSEVPTAAIEAAFVEFAERGLMFLDDKLALALALPAVPAR